MIWGVPEAMRDKWKVRIGFREPSGESYKQFTLVNYDSRVVVTSKLLIFTTLDL